MEDLVAALGVTRTAVVSHLKALQADGVAARRGLRAGSRRPSVVYELTEAADRLFPKAYEAFAALVLDELKRTSPTALRRILRRVGAQWIAEDLPRVQKLSGRARWERVQEILAERGFMPALDRTPSGWVLREHNCPVMRLANEHPEVCDTIHHWLEALFGVSLARTQCLRNGDPYSAYTIRATVNARR